MSGNIELKTEELIAALQTRIGQYEVERIAAELVITKQRERIAALESAAE